MLPANQAIQLVTSGAFGLLYYHEAGAPSRILAERLLAGSGSNRTSSSVLDCRGALDLGVHHPSEQGAVSR